MTSRASMDDRAVRQRLIAIAQRRDKLLSELLLLARSQRQMLVKADHTDLLDNIKAQDGSLVELERLDRQEEMILESSPDALRSSPDFYRDYLDFARGTARTAELLKTIVEGNRELLDNAMQYVAFSLGAISTVAASRQSYDPAPEASGDSLALMLDSKV